MIFLFSIDLYSEKENQPPPENHVDEKLWLAQFDTPLELVETNWEKTAAIRQWELANCTNGGINRQLSDWPLYKSYLGSSLVSTFSNNVFTM